MALHSVVRTLFPAPRALRRAGAPDFGRDVHCVLGLPFDAVDLAGAVQRVRTAVAQRRRCFISTPNLNFLIACRGDAAFRDSVINSNLSMADGMPVVWVARLLGIPVRERVPGSDLFDALRDDASQRLSVYLFGGPEGAAAAASARLNAEAAGVRCAGFEAPGFGSLEAMSSEASIAAINASGADFLLVALGARKGQAWIERNRARISVPVISHLGAVMNFAAGTVRRAPAWMQHGGVEWLWRILQEPALWRRYAADGLAFAGLLATRVLPGMLHRRAHAPRRPELDAADIATHRGADALVVCLRGAWTRDNLQPLRDCFSSAAAAGTAVRVNLEQVTCVDEAVLGLLLLLHGSQRGNGLPFACLPPLGPARKAFRFGCCEFLLDGAAS